MKLSKAIILGLSVGTLLLFSGCSMKNDFNVILPASYKAQKQHDYKLAAINVQLASESQKTGDLDVFDPSYSTSFENALNKALNDTNIFKNDSDRKVQIKVVVLKNDAPAMGLDMTISAEVIYEIKDQNGKLLYSNRINSQGLATVGDKFVGVERMILANDRAIQNNIKLFLDDVQSKQF